MRHTSAAKPCVEFLERKALMSKIGGGTGTAVTVTETADTLSVKLTSKSADLKAADHFSLTVSQRGSTTPPSHSAAVSNAAAATSELNSLLSAFEATITVGTPITNPRSTFTLTVNGQTVHVADRSSYAVSTTEDEAAVAAVGLDMTYGTDGLIYHEKVTVKVTQTGSQSVSLSTIDSQTSKLNTSVDSALSAWVNSSTGTS